MWCLTLSGQQVIIVRMMTRRQVIAATCLPMLRASGVEKILPEWQVKLEAIRIKHGLPGLGGALLTVDGLLTQAVAGVRKAGTEVEVTVADLWHLGSNTKAMTATLAALAVQAGKLRWDSTLGEVFPQQEDLKKSLLSQATLAHLLTHWSGLPANTKWRLLLGDGRDLRGQREAALQAAAGTPDLPTPGEKHLYSNWGYVLAGHMLEQVWDVAWEGLIQSEVFTPLGISHAGFGGTGTLGQIDQPWPHGADGQPMQNNGPNTDNPPVMGPAGTVHMPMSDWAKFIAEHLAGRMGKGSLLSHTADYLHLHTPAVSGSSYAFGWSAMERKWGGHVISHNGSNTMNRSITWLAPEKGFAVLACTNAGSEKAQLALDDVCSLLIQQHLKS